MEKLNLIEELEKQINNLQSKLTECETKRKLEAQEYLKNLQKIQSQINLLKVNECEEAEFIKEILLLVLDNKRDEAIKKLVEYVI